MKIRVWLTIVLLCMGVSAGTVFADDSDDNLEGEEGLDLAVEPTEEVIETTETEVTTEEKLHRVAILDFRNSQELEDIDYLSTNIPDMLQTKLEESEHFDLIPRETVQETMTSMGIESDQLFDSTYAAQLGEELKTDVVVLGRFWQIEDKLLIIIRAISSADQRTYAEEEILGSALDPFILIDTIVKNTKDKMIEVLPSIRSLVEIRTERETLVKTVIREKIIKRNVQSLIDRDVTFAEQATAAYTEARGRRSRVNRFGISIGLAIPFLAPIYITARAFDTNASNLTQAQSNTFAISLGMLFAASVLLPLNLSLPKKEQLARALEARMLPQFILDSDTFTAQMFAMDRVYVNENIHRSYAQWLDEKKRKRFVAGITLSSIGASILIPASIAFSLTDDLTSQEVRNYASIPTQFLLTHLLGGTLLNKFLPNQQEKFVALLDEDPAGSQVRSELNQGSLTSKDYLFYQYLKARHQVHRGYSWVNRDFFKSILLTLGSLPLFINGVSTMKNPDNIDVGVVGRIEASLALGLMLTCMVGIVSPVYDREHAKAFPAMFLGVSSLVVRGIPEISGSTYDPLRSGLAGMSVFFFSNAVANIALSFMKTDFMEAIRSGEMSLDEAMGKVVKKQRILRYINGGTYTFIGALIGIFGPAFTLANVSELGLSQMEADGIATGAIAGGLIVATIGVVQLFRKTEAQLIQRLAVEAEKEMKDSDRLAAEASTIQPFLSFTPKQNHVQLGFSMQF